MKGPPTVLEEVRPLVKLLDGPTYCNADIYRYFHALEDSWSSFADQAPRTLAEIER